MLRVFDKDVYTSKCTLGGPIRTAAQYQFVGLYAGSHSFDPHTQQMISGGTTTDYIPVPDYDYSVQQSDDNMNFSFDTADMSFGVGVTLVLNKVVARVAESLSTMKIKSIPRGVIDTETFGGIVKQCTTIHAPDWAIITGAAEKRCGPHSKSCDLLVKLTPLRTQSVRIRVEAEDTSVHDVFEVQGLRVDLPNSVADGGK